MSVVLGSSFEAGMIAAAGLTELNIEPGSIRVADMSADMVTARFTIVTAVPKATVMGLASEALGVTPN